MDWNGEFLRFQKIFQRTLLNFVSFYRSLKKLFCVCRNNNNNDKFFRISSSKVFFIKGVPQNVVKCLGSPSTGVSFFIILQAWGLQLQFKKDSDTGVFEQTSGNVWKHTFLYKTPSVPTSCFFRFGHLLPTIYLNLDFLSFNFPLCGKNKSIEKLPVAEKTL